MANMSIEMRAPSKLFWQVPFGKLINNNYVCLDQVLGELTCSTCYYQCYGRKRMERHIVEKHSSEEDSNANEQELWPKVIVEDIGATPKNLPTSTDDFNENVRKYAADLGFYVQNRSNDQPEHMEHPDIIINDMEPSPNTDPDIIDQSSKDQEHAEVTLEPTGDSVVNIPNEDNLSFKLSETNSLSLDFAADDVTFSTTNSETSGDCHANPDSTQDNSWRTIRSSETSSLISNSNFTDFTISTILEEKPRSEIESQTPDSPMEPNTDQPKSSTEDNWTTVRSSETSSLIAKFTPEDVSMDTSEESGMDQPKSSTPDQPDNTLSFHCKDLVLGELICDYCLYTNFSKSTMIRHLKKKHQWTEPIVVKVADEAIIEAPIIEIPSAISPIHEKHVTFADQDTIITDFSLDSTPTSSTFKTVTKKKPFIYDGSDILNKLFAMEP